MKIPFKRLNFSEAAPAINELLDSGFIGLGEKVFEFENALAEYVGAKYVVATDSCTSALFISLMWEKMHNGLHTVVIPAMTVPLVAAAVKEAGLNLKFDNRTDWVGSAYNLRRTKIMDSAHQLERGMCADMSEETKYCFSFYPTKPVGSADGGAIATNNEAFAKWARSVITYGRNQTQKYQNSWEYDVELVGYKRHYTNLQAVICLEQLMRLDKTNKRRIEIRDRFNKAFGLNNVSLYLYRLQVGNRDDFMVEMDKLGIECGVHFKPLHLMKAYEGTEWDGESESVMQHYTQTVTIPFYEDLTDEQVTYIIDAVQSWIAPKSKRKSKR